MILPIIITVLHCNPSYDYDDDDSFIVVIITRQVLKIRMITKLLREGEKHVRG